MPKLPIAQVLESLTDEIAGLDGGTPATYIPVLAEADPSWFGMSLVTMDGHVYAAGDSSRRFTIQSDLEAVRVRHRARRHGPRRRPERVGVEPSGDPFNSIAVDDEVAPSAQPDGQRGRDRRDEPSAG